MYPQLCSAHAEDYASESWYCVSWQPIYTIPALPDQVSLAKGSFLTFHSLTAEPVPIAPETEPEPVQVRGRTRSRSCSPNQQVNVTQPLSPVPRLKIEVVEGNDSDTSSPNSSPVGSTPGGSSVRRERSHSSPALGRRDRGEMLSPGSQHSASSGRSSSKKSGRKGGRTNCGDPEFADGGPAFTPRAGDAPAARDLSPQLDAAAAALRTVAGEIAEAADKADVSDDADGGSGTKADDTLVSPPKVEEGDGGDEAADGSDEGKEKENENEFVAIEAMSFPALGSMGGGAAVGKDGDKPEAAAAAAAPSAKSSAWGGRSFAAILRAPAKEEVAVPGPTAAERIAAAVAGPSMASIAAAAAAKQAANVVRLPLAGAPDSTPIVAVTISPKVSPRAAEAKNPEANPLGKQRVKVKLTGAWKQSAIGSVEVTAAVTTVVAAPTVAVVTAPAIATPPVSTRTALAKVVVESVAAAAEGGARPGKEQEQRPGDDAKGDETKAAEVSAVGPKPAAKTEQGQAAAVTVAGEEADEDMGVYMSPSLIGLGVGGRVDRHAWELIWDEAAAAAVPGRPPPSSPRLLSAGEEKDDAQARLGGFKPLQDLITAVPRLLSDQRVALPGAPPNRNPWLCPRARPLRISTNIPLCVLCRCGADYEPIRGWPTAHRR